MNSTVRLGDVLSERRERVKVAPDGVYPMAGVYGFGRGILVRDAVLGANIAASHLYRIEQDQIVYSRLKAFEGAFALVTPEAHGRFVSNEFPSFDVDSTAADPRFLALILQTPATWAEMSELITGMGSRRERLKVDDFLSFEFVLPSLGEQQSIVGATSVLRQLLAAANAELSQAGDLYRAGLERSVSVLVDTVVPLSEVVRKLASGRSPRCEDRPPTPDEWAVLKVSSVRQVSFEPAAAKALPRTETPFATAEVRPGDLLTIRASGSARLVGAFCIADAPPPRLLMSDYHWRVEVDDERVDPRYLMHVMGSQLARDQLELAIVGSTTAAKLSKGRLLEVEVPIPALDIQRRIADRLDAIQALMQASTREVEALQALRPALATKLLSGGPPASDLSAVPSMS